MGHRVLVVPAGRIETACVVQTLVDAGIEAVTVPVAPVHGVVALALDDSTAVAAQGLQVMRKLPCLLLTQPTTKLQQLGPIMASVECVSTAEGTAALVDAVHRMLVGSPLHRSTSVSGDSSTAGLTVREQEVVELVGQGRSNGQIAAELGISYHTARTHVGRVMRKVGVTHRGALAARARRGELAAANEQNLGTSSTAGHR